MKNKISYHNRMREKNFIDIFESLGTKTERQFVKIDQSAFIELEKMKINKRFSEMTHEELAVSGSGILLTFIKSGK